MSLSSPHFEHFFIPRGAVSWLKTLGFQHEYNTAER
jgi:hypothetical protein